MVLAPAPVLVLVLVQVTVTEQVTAPRSQRS